MLQPKSLIEMLLSLFVARLLITGASIGDALAILSLSGVYGLYLHIESKKEPRVNQDILDRLASVEDKASKTETKVGAVLIKGR
jgi:hypothetical protein